MAHLVLNQTAHPFFLPEIRPSDLWSDRYVTG